MALLVLIQDKKPILVFFEIYQKQNHTPTTTITILCLVAEELSVFLYTKEPGDILQKMRIVAPVSVEQMVSGELTNE